MKTLLLIWIMGLIDIASSECPSEPGIDYLGNDIKDIANVKSPQDCSGQCHSILSCYGWTWVSPSYGVTSQRNHCYIKDFNFRKGRKELAGVVSGAKGCGLNECPSEPGIDYPGYDIKDIANVKSPQACSGLCKSIPACYGWTWVSSIYGVTSQRNHCYIKDSNFRKGREELAGVVSGAKGCGLKECPSQPGIDYLGNDIKDIANVKSPEDCSGLCQSIPACHGWTWVSSSYGVTSQRKHCYIKDFNFRKGRKELAGVVSGAKHCHRVACPSEPDIDYLGNDIRDIANVKSPEDCSGWCQSIPACYGWTWVSPSYGVTSQRDHCYIKDFNFKKGRKELAAVVSGAKGCGLNECPAEPGIDYGGNDIRHIANVKSPEDCSGLCQTMHDCYGWTWVSPTFVRAWQHNRCYIKNRNFRNSGRKTLAGVVSAAKGCGL